MNDGDPYQPSNGTEGMSFMARWCDQCVKMPHSPDAKNQCRIQLNTMVYRVTDKAYPRQWRYQDGNPVCTAFKSREQYNAERRKRPAARRLIATDGPDLFG